MSIRDKENYMKRLPDWKIIEGCFGNPKISPTDVDGMVEENGHFLYLEWKTPGNSPTEGQIRNFEALSKLNQFTVIIVYGDAEDGTVMGLKWMNTNGRKSLKGDINTLRNWVKHWSRNTWKWAGNDVDPVDPIDYPDNPIPLPC